MLKKHQRWIATAALMIMITVLPLAQAGAENNQTQANEMRAGLVKAFEGWSVAENSAHHVNFTVTGKNIAFPGVTDNSEASLQAAAPQVRVLLAQIIDFDHYGLGSPRVNAAGRLGLVTFDQTKNGDPVESDGIRCAFNRQGMLVFVKIGLLELPASRPSISTAQVRAEDAARAEYASSTIESLTYDNVVYAEGDDGAVYLCHRFDIKTWQPSEAWRVYVDVTSGKIVKTLSISDNIGVTVDGNISKYGGNYPNAQFELWTCCTGDPDAQCMWGSNGYEYANDTGYYYLREPQIGEYCRNPYVRFHVADPVSFSQIDYSGTGSYGAVWRNSDPIVIPGNKQMIKATIDFDWTETDVYAEHAQELINYWQVSGTLTGMHDWLSGWLPEIQYYEQVALRVNVECPCGIAGFCYYGNPVILEICDTYEDNDAVICHEMAHGVHYMCAILPYELNPWPATFWREGQAEHFAGSYLGVGVPNLGTSVDYCNPSKCLALALNYDSHAWGAVQAGAWYDMVAALGWAYIDELVWASGLLDVSTQGNAVRSLFIADDDDGDLSNGTPNFGAINTGYEAHYLGPWMPLVWLRDSTLAKCGGRNNLLPNVSYRWEVIDTYAWDSLVWDFGDGSAKINAMAVDYQYTECGPYEIICEAYHSFGVNVDTFSVLVSTGDIFYTSSEEGSDDYRFQIDLSLTNAVVADTIVVPIRYDGAVDMGFDSIYVAGTRLDGWNVSELLNDPQTYSVVFQFTGPDALSAGAGVIANLFFTAYDAPLLNDYTSIRVESCGGYDPLVTHGWDFDCGIRGAAAGKYTLIYYSGDLDGDGYVTMLDYLYYVEWLWNNGPAPVHYWSADVDCDGSPGPMDALYLYEYIVNGGPPPCGNLYVGQYDE